jgi:glyoxylase-like metal-dependent hydrolase (beta-lactamase superfamily II)
MKHVLWALAAACILAACATKQEPAAKEEPAATQPAVQLYAMDCGRISVTNADGFADDGAYAGQARDLVVPCYLIRHPQGDLLWDVGVPQSIADLPNGVFSQGPFRIQVTRKLTDQLAQLGLQPSDIEYLSVSHSHFDHIGNGGLFARSTWIVDPDERAHAFRPEVRTEQAFASYSALENAPTRLIEGDADLDVFGDGSVVIIPTPGHTPGHTVLLVRLREAGAVMLSGDLWHIAESRAARRVPRFNTDRAQTLQSMDKFERIARETGARVVIEHVPADFEALPRFPEALQ